MLARPYAKCFTYTILFYFIFYPMCHWAKSISSTWQSQNSVQKNQTVNVLACLPLWVSARQPQVLAAPLTASMNLSLNPSKLVPECKMKMTILS